MPRATSPRSFSSHDGAIIPKGTFMANRDKVVDKPRPAVFSIGGKKMFQSPTTGGVGDVLGLPRTDSMNGNGSAAHAAENGAAGLSTQRMTTPTGKRMNLSLKNVASGAVPVGAERNGNSLTGASSGRAHVGSPVSKHQEDIPSGRRQTHVINCTKPSEFTAVCASKKNVQVMYDLGKRKTSVPESQHKVPPTTTKLQSSQRYSATSLKNAETAQNTQPGHKSSIVISNKHYTKSLVGVMMADPLPRPASAPRPAPWAQMNFEQSPKGRRASPLRPQEADGFSPGGYERVSGLRHVPPTVQDNNEATKPAGRRHSPLQRSISPFALHI